MSIEKSVVIDLAILVGSEMESTVLVAARALYEFIAVSDLAERSLVGMPVMLEQASFPQSYFLPIFGEYPYLTLPVCMSIHLPTMFCKLYWAYTNYIYTHTTHFLNTFISLLPYKYNNNKKKCHDLLNIF